MRVRFTESAARDFDQSVEYLRTEARTVVGDFAVSVAKAIFELLDHPYSAQETTHPACAENMSADSAIPFFTRLISRPTNW